MSPKDLGLSYRYSVLMEQKGTVLSSVFALNPGDPQEIRGKMSELMQKRKEKHVSKEAERSPDGKASRSRERRSICRR